MAVAAAINTAEIKRRVLAEASKMSSVQINNKVNELLTLWEKRRKQCIDTEELEIELQFYGELWTRRRN